VYVERMQYLLLLKIIRLFFLPLLLELQCPYKQHCVLSSNKNLNGNGKRFEKYGWTVLESQRCSSFCFVCHDIFSL
jgi:hypothetical protein